VTGAGAAAPWSLGELEADAPVPLHGGESSVAVLDVVTSPLEPDVALLELVRELATAVLTCVLFAAERAGSRPAAICT